MLRRYGDRGGRFEIVTVCEYQGTTFDFEECWSIPHTEFSPSVRDSIETNPRTVVVSHRRIVSGTDHDANYLNEHIEVELVFILSVHAKVNSKSEHEPWS
jgi:N-carbamoyl-L-amino-acid hydrolase